MDGISERPVWLCIVFCQRLLRLTFSCLILLGFRLFVSDCPQNFKVKMTLQWTAVALFLYVEIGVILILCLPFISARRQVTDPECVGVRHLLPQSKITFRSFCSSVLFQVAEHFSAKNLGVYGKVLEQSVPYHDNHTCCSLPW